MLIQTNPASLTSSTFLLSLIILILYYIDDEKSQYNTSVHDDTQFPYTLISSTRKMKKKVLILRHQFYVCTVIHHKRFFVSWYRINCVLRIWNNDMAKFLHLNWVKTEEEMREHSRREMIEKEVIKSYEHSSSRHSPMGIVFFFFLWIRIENEH